MLIYSLSMDSPQKTNLRFGRQITHAAHYTSHWDFSIQWISILHDSQIQELFHKSDTKYLFRYIQRC